MPRLAGFNPRLALIVFSGTGASFSKQADCSLTTSFSGPKSSRDFRETGPRPQSENSGGLEFGLRPQAETSGKPFEIRCVATLPVKVE